MKFTTLLTLAAAALVSAEYSQSSKHVPGIQHVLENWNKSPLASYPTDFTRGIIPKRLHSHNDYWRDVPLYSALSVGAISVEADVWLYGDTLYIGHDTSSLTPARTFSSLYIDPIVSILEKANPNHRFAHDTKNGVFDTSVGQTLYLWVDMKTSGPETLPAMIKALEPLRQKGLLTTLEDGVVKQGPVTVIGTGNTPMDLVQKETKRDYFFDGPLKTLKEQNVTKELSPIASAQLSAVTGEVGVDGLTATQIDAVKAVVAEANGRGIEVRFWDLPGWPISTRNKIWLQLFEAGVYLLNVDDLEAGAGLGGIGAEW